MFDEVAPGWAGRLGCARLVGSAAGRFELRRGDGVWGGPRRQQRGHEFVRRGSAPGRTNVALPGSCLWDGRYGDMKWEFPGARNNAQGSPQEASEPLGASMAKRPSLAARAPRAWESPPHAVDAS